MTPVETARAKWTAAVLRFDDARLAWRTAPAAVQKAEYREMLRAYSTMSAAYKALEAAKVAAVIAMTSPVEDEGWRAVQARTKAIANQRTVAQVTVTETKEPSHANA